jgi:DNA-binding CsgD family transcriptional regulator
VTGESLTANEVRALQYAANGLTQPNAARTFGISHRSYRRLLSSACEKLDAANITHAVAIAATLRLIGAGTLPPPDAAGDR